MKRFIHFLMGIEREQHAEPAFEERLRNAVRELDEKLAASLRELAAATSERNRVRARAEQTMATADHAYEAARQAVRDGDDARARTELERWAASQQAADALGGQLAQLDRSCVALSGRVQQLRTRLGQTHRNANTLLSRRFAARAQQRLAEAVSAGEAECAAQSGWTAPEEATPGFDIDAELKRLRGSDLDS